MSSVYSTDLETSALVESASASVSKSAAASEAYDDESFDDYSDSFESDTEAPSPEASVVSIAPALLRVGTRVQVYWEEENEWFDGVVRAVEEGNKPRYYVHYDDGEQAWENSTNARPLPMMISDATLYDQLQQLLPLSSQKATALINRKAIVYWPEEAEWYKGTVSAAQASPAALKIEYDDGDSRWEQEHTFQCILLARAAHETTPEHSKVPIPTSPPGHVLYARQYRRAVINHFEPVRVARPYCCALDNHTRSIIIPRRTYTERKYLHAVHESLECYRHSSHTTPSSWQTEKADCIIQTTLSSFLTET